MDAAYGSVLMKRLLLHHVLHPDAHDLEKTPMEDVLSKCGQESTLPWLMASAISMCKVRLLASMTLTATIIISAKADGYCTGDCPLLCPVIFDVHFGYRFVAQCLQGLFIGVGEMRGLGLQHLHGMGFLMGRIMGDDGLPVWSGPSYLEIASSRSGVGVGENHMLTICKTCIFL